MWPGVHQPRLAADLPRCVISFNALERRKSGFDVNDWVLDSGSFTRLARGVPHVAPTAYAEAADRWAACGRLRAVVAQDWMCEPWMIAATGLSVAEHQRRSTAAFEALRGMTAQTVMPVVQGWRPEDYARHARTIDAPPGSWGRAPHPRRRRIAEQEAPMTAPIPRTAAALLLLAAACGAPAAETGFEVASDGAAPGAPAAAKAALKALDGAADDLRVSAGDVFAFCDSDSPDGTCVDGDTTYDLSAWDHQVDDVAGPAEIAWQIAQDDGPCGDADGDDPTAPQVAAALSAVPALKQAAADWEKTGVGTGEVTDSLTRFEAAADAAETALTAAGCGP